MHNINMCSSSSSSDSPSFDRISSKNISNTMTQFMDHFPMCSEIFLQSNALDTVYFVGYGIVMTTLIGLGIVGNVLNLLVFCSPRVWATLNYYLIALALWDLALLTTSFAFWSFWSIYYRGGVRLFGNHVDILRYAYIAGNVTLTGCIWVIVTLTVERYLSIQFPLRHKTLNNASRAKVILLAVSFGVLLFNAARPLEVQLAQLSCCLSSPKQTAQLVSVTYITPSVLRSNQVYFLAYRVLGSILFVYLVPCCILAFLTVRMCFALRKATRERKSICIYNHQRSPSLAAATMAKMSTTAAPNIAGELSARHRNLTESSASERQTSAEASVNRMLSVVLVKFLLCYTLPTVNDLLELLLPKQLYQSESFVEVLVISSNVLVVLNSSCNFFIYFATGRRFRKECLYILRHCSYRISSRSPTSSFKTSFRPASPPPHRKHCTTTESAAFFGSISPMLKRQRSSQRQIRRPLLLNAFEEQQGIICNGNSSSMKQREKQGEFCNGSSLLESEPVHGVFCHGRYLKPPSPVEVEKSS